MVSYHGSPASVLDGEGEGRTDDKYVGRRQDLMHRTPVFCNDVYEGVSILIRRFDVDSVCLWCVIGGWRVAGVLWTRLVPKAPHASEYFSGVLE